MSNNSLKRLVKKGIISVVRTEKVAVFHPGRCGSTVLGNLLNQNHKMYCWGEPFENHMQKGRALEKWQSKDIIREAELAKISKAFFFETKFPVGMHLSEDCINMTIPDYVDFLRELGYNKFIYLTRLNLLKRALSMEKGRVTGQWHTKDKVIPKSISLDPNRFEIGLDRYMPLADYFTVMEQEERLLLDAIGEQPLLRLDYENDIEQNPQKAYEKICKFMEIPAVPVSVKLKKTNAAPLSSLLGNYEDIKDSLSDTNYAWMLDNEQG